MAERRQEWASVPRRRRQAYSVSLYFMLTGLMSLVSLVSSSDTTLWRLAFGITGALGVLETAASIFRARSEPEREGRVHGVLWLSLLLYALVVAVAAHRTLPSDIGLHLKPLETEAIILSLLIFVGVNYAWLLFMEPPHPEPRRGG